MMMDDVVEKDAESFELNAVEDQPLCYEVATNKIGLLRKVLSLLGNAKVVTLHFTKTGIKVIHYFVHKGDSDPNDYSRSVVRMDLMLSRHFFDVYNCHIPPPGSETAQIRVSTAELTAASQCGKDCTTLVWNLYHHHLDVHSTNGRDVTVATVYSETGASLDPEHSRQFAMVFQPKQSGSALGYTAMFTVNTKVIREALRTAKQLRATRVDIMYADGDKYLGLTCYSDGNMKTLQTKIALSGTPLQRNDENERSIDVCKGSYSVNLFLKALGTQMSSSVILSFGSGNPAVLTTLLEREMSVHSVDPMTKRCIDLRDRSAMPADFESKGSSETQSIFRQFVPSL